MPRFSLLLLSLALLAPISAHAARIYNIVDYPDLQNGHSLSGTITTTDDAPDDGMLQEEEVLDWHWEISGPNNITADWVEENSVFTNNILITEDQIQLVLDSNSGMVLITPQDFPTVSLQWVTIKTSVDENLFFSEVAAGFIGRDGLIPYWTSQVETNGETNWVIATVVPEPAAIFIGIVFIITLTTCRTTKKSI